MSDDFDPQPQDREYWRSTSTGDRGYIVKRKGVEVIRLDRPMQELIFPKTQEWIADEFGSLMLESQAAGIAFAADREVCRAVGLHLESRRGWQDLSDQERMKFTKDGPARTANPIRGVVYDAILMATRPYTREND
jgi:hypothetical protein